MTSYRDLLRQRQQLDADIRMARARERQEAVRKIKEWMLEYDISASELSLGPRRTRSTTRRSRYWNPVTGATWSGRGRMPDWLVGQDLEAFRLKDDYDDGSTADAVRSPPAPAGNATHDPQQD
ncbi:hypothetical protein WJ95_05810 [Burkholderia ubonensis]|uniref:H-NS histone family protein n=1 Tax=Burkholderia ubonensis TaxID=101571 RepID=UPI0007553221|nr:H-NS histone family protein [Burkholderia ubonensis]KVP93115.1 hypothetical protein WJ95_05810 [Burkholderia ubonensis]